MADGSPRMEALQEMRQSNDVFQQRIARDLQKWSFMAVASHRESGHCEMHHPFLLENGCKGKSMHVKSSNWLLHWLRTSQVLDTSPLLKFSIKQLSKSMFHLQVEVSDEWTCRYSNLSRVALITRLAEIYRNPFVNYVDRLVDATCGNYCHICCSVACLREMKAIDDDYGSAASS